MKWRRFKFAALRWQRTDTPGEYEAKTRITVVHGKTRKMRTENVVVRVYSTGTGRQWSAEIDTVSGFEVGKWHGDFRTKGEAAATMFKATKIMWVQMRDGLNPLSQGNLMDRYERGEELW